jgi:hypothetical protein
MTRHLISFPNGAMDHIPAFAAASRREQQVRESMPDPEVGN